MKPSVHGLEFFYIDIYIHFCRHFTDFHWNVQFTVTSCQTSMTSIWPKHMAKNLIDKIYYSESLCGGNKAAFFLAFPAYVRLYPKGKQTKRILWQEAWRMRTTALLLLIFSHLQFCCSYSSCSGSLSGMTGVVL